MRDLFLCAMFLIITGASFGQTSKGLDLRVNNVGWNSTYATVTKQLGKPLKVKKSTMKAGNHCTGDAQTFVTLTYRGLEVSLIGDGRGKGMRVYEMLVTDKRWLASGIRIGTDVEGVKGEFGEPNEVVDQDGTSTFYYHATDESTQVSIEFRDGKVTKILVAESIC